MKNKYAVKIEDLETGKIFYFYHKGVFRQVMIPVNYDPYKLEIEIVTQEWIWDKPIVDNITITVDDLYKEAPSSWMGKVYRF